MTAGAKSIVASYEQIFKIMSIKGTYLSLHYLI